MPSQYHGANLFNPYLFFVFCSKIVYTLRHNKERFFIVLKFTLEFQIESPTADKSCWTSDAGVAPSIPFKPLYSLVKLPLQQF